MRALAQLVGRRPDGVGVAPNAGPGPFLVQRVRVADIQVGGGRVQVGPGVHSQVQVYAVPDGKPVLVTALVGDRADAWIGAIGVFGIRNFSAAFYRK